jgi:hypothetical protein
MEQSINKCNINFKTQYAYIDNKCIHISEYLQLSRKPTNIKCLHKHDLIPVNATQRKKHFRHKYKNDVGGNPLSEWHIQWQSYFPETEVKFMKKNKNDEQTKNRRADIVIREHNIVIEIQHSKITSDEVICRNGDYGLHNMKLIWVIDGNTNDIKKEQLTTGGYLISFNHLLTCEHDHKRPTDNINYNNRYGNVNNRNPYHNCNCDWKYKSFCKTYDYVLLDIENNIFKIPVKKIRGGMILLNEPKPLDEVVKKLKNDPCNIWDLWEDDNEIKATLRVLQKGAGNGKTYSIWKSISENHNKTRYIIVTKQHTAKEVIKAELDEQAERNEFHITDNMDDIEHDAYGRHLIVNYQHKYTKRLCTVFISTIDALMFALSSTDKTSTDKFLNILNTIRENGCDKINTNTGKIKYAGKNVPLNKKTELWIDETQDLSIHYYHAIIKLMMETKMDVVVVGDKLQSLEHINNFMTNTEIDNIPNINIVKEPPENINRRILVDHMADRINDIITFDELPSIEMADDTQLDDRGKNVFIEINSPNIYGNDKDIAKISKFATEIIDYVDAEVEEHNYMPENFLFIFPIMKANTLADELETRLNEYWINKLDNTDSTYTQYAVLHKHEEGQVIDTTLSKHATRLMSIRSSKGDGREVVFVLNCTEHSLKMVSNNEINLLYESNLHVALTRAKCKIYFGLVNNNDDIHRRLYTAGIVEYKPRIQIEHIAINKLVDLIDDGHVIQLLQEHGIPNITIDKQSQFAKQEIIDWNYHCIRYAIYYQYVIFGILSRYPDNKSQISTVLRKISDLRVYEKDPVDFYAFLREHSQVTDNLPYLPLCKLSSKTVYESHRKEIFKIITKLQYIFKNDPLKLKTITPLEAVIQTYIIKLYKNKYHVDITPSTIYNIVDFFKQGGTKVTELLKEPSEHIHNIIDNVFNNIKKDHNNITWNIEHMIYLQGSTKKNMSINYKFPIIGYDDDTVYHIMLKIEHSSINYWNNLIELLFQRFLIFNPSDNLDKNEGRINNIQRYSEKKIKSYLFILKQHTYEVFDWDWDRNLNIRLKQLLKDAVIKYLTKYNEQLFRYYTYIKRDETIWRLYENPLIYMMETFEDIPYVNKIFDDLNSKCDTEKENVLRVTNNNDQFCELFGRKIEYICDVFFKLKRNNARNSNNDVDNW